MKKSSFSARVIELNGLSICGFQSWAFHRGMLFDAQDAWWGSQKKRDRPHEGLDLCLYVDREGTHQVLGGHAKIPVIYDGDVAGISDDFLGQSIYVKHAIRDGSGNMLYSAYGHTSPATGIEAGVAVVEGQLIAVVAAAVRRKVGPAPHLHISLFWVPESPELDVLDWDTISAREVVKPIDPLEFLDLPYMLLA